MIVNQHKLLFLFDYNITTNAVFASIGEFFKIIYTSIQSTFRDSEIKAAKVFTSYHYVVHWEYTQR